jgi:hypothetical protein
MPLITYQSCKSWPAPFCLTYSDKECVNCCVGFIERANVIKPRIFIQEKHMMYIPSSVSKVSACRLDNVGLIPSWVSAFSLSNCIQTGSGAYPASYAAGTRVFIGGQSDWSMKLTTHLHLVMSKM